MKADFSFMLETHIVKMPMTMLTCLCVAGPLLQVFNKH